MSTVPVSYQPLTRIARMFVVVLFFLCAGPLIQLAMAAILMVCYVVLSAGEDLFSGETLGWLVHFIDLHGRRLLWPTLVSLAPLAGLTGLIAVIWDTMFVRVTARIMLVISLIMALAALILFVWRSAPVLIDAFDRDPGAAWSFLAPVLIQRFCYVLSMMVCWKLVDLVRGKAPAARSLAPT
jgi:hypothetical protein